MPKRRGAGSTVEFINPGQIAGFVESEGAYMTVSAILGEDGVLRETSPAKVFTLVALFGKTGLQFSDGDHRVAAFIASEAHLPAPESSADGVEATRAAIAASLEDVVAERFSGRPVYLSDLSEQAAAAGLAHVIGLDPEYCSSGDATFA